ncbi:uncharacterized protein LOC132734219 isoform X2 [Ruditapes philippinarum]|uniref:uncharacterized protein LOC132734219 isoform X2 n=1 Tax=Ruditapes philippinarum TaxID=129788 RepID=UPI00295BEE59|nr:uncharacterized protein LOC132734219 isoform X2 [Ruditapes philippinarum]
MCLTTLVSWEVDNAKRKLNEPESKFKNKLFKDTVNGRKLEFNEDHLIVAVLSILFIVILHLVLILGHIFYHEWKYFKTEMIKDFPVPCSSLSLSADEDYVTFDLNKSVLKTYIDDKGNYICSKNNLSEILQTVVERVSRVQLAQGQDKRYLSCGNESLREASGYQTVFFREILKQENNSVQASIPSNNLTSIIQSRKNATGHKKVSLVCWLIGSILAMCNIVKLTQQTINCTGINIQVNAMWTTRLNTTMVR